MPGSPDQVGRLARALAERYRVERELGAGGMATVYLAHDLKHDRQVAIKVLRPELSASLGTARFLREIHVAAQLQHPHILTLIDSGDADGLVYYVMPYVEGESLRTRIAREGRLPVADTVRVLRDVSDGLSYAHSHGVVHRDVKPENVMLSGRHALVMDFGIAKGLSAASGPQALTTAGMTLGTPAYMAPEQVAADPELDHRADLYALGVLGYEMLAGRPPLLGAGPQGTLAAQVTQRPDPVIRHRPGMPAALNALIMRCLEKAPSARYQSAAELVEQLEGLAPTETAARPAPRARGRRTIAIALGVLVAAAAVVAWATRVVMRPTRTQPTLQQATFRQGVQQSPAWSPDGRVLAFSGDAGAVRKIFLKRMDTGEERPLTTGPHDEHDELQPAWSPDGRRILFVRGQKVGVRLEPGDVFGEYDGGDIWAADVLTGQAALLMENAFDPSYAPQGDRMAFDASWAGPRRIWIADAQGHNPEQLTADSSEAVTHIRPRWSPDGSKIVFQNIERTNFNIRVVDVRSRKAEWITTGLFQDLAPVWSSSGRSIYFSSMRGGGLNLWRVPVRREGTASGMPQQVTTGGGQDVDPATSPDGRRLAFSNLRQNADLWRLPVSPETGQPTGPPQSLISTTREDSRGAWSPAPDLERIAFNSDRAGHMNIWLYSLADRSTRQLTQGSGGDFQPNWSPDGARIAFFSSRAGNIDVWTVDVASGTLTQLTHDPAIDANPFFSPDGRRVAYQSDQSGRLEVWVMNADGAEPRQLSHVGVMGHFLRWTTDGRYVVFKCPCGARPRVLRVSLDGGEPQPEPEVAGGSHLSFNPGHSRIMDVVGHKTLWVSPVGEGAAKPGRVFSFDDPDVRIDYPVWSPDGKWVLFDRFRPQGGDIWVIAGVE